MPHHMTLYTPGGRGCKEGEGSKRKIDGRGDRDEEETEGCGRRVLHFIRRVVVWRGHRERAAGIKENIIESRSHKKGKRCDIVFKKIHTR